MSTTPTPRFNRVLLKVSGEGLCEKGGRGIDGAMLESLAQEILQAKRTGAQIAVVVGGGNIIRGSQLAREGRIERATADYMGMLGTVINALAIKEMLEKLGQPARVLSAINLTSVAEPFVRARAIRHMEKGRVIILAAGTGNPFFTTDTCAALRAVEIGADAVLKATKVDGVYDKDPVKFPDAVRYDHLSFERAIEQNLGVMDTAAFSLCMEHNIPIIVFNLRNPGHIAEVIMGKPHGTVVGPKIR